MADFSMSYSAMENTAKNIDQAKENLEEAKKSIKDAVDLLAEGYNGQGYDAFKQSWEEFEPRIQRMIEAVGYFSPALRKAAEKQRELDGTTGHDMGRLGSGSL